MPEIFRIIHLSDFHFCVEPRRVNLISLAERRPRLRIDADRKQVHELGFLSFAKPASYSPQVTAGAVQFCYMQQNVVDGVVVTGDLATTGLQLDIAVARDYTMAEPFDGFSAQTGRPTFKASGLPMWVLPGNHDKYSDNFATPKSRNFELTFGPLMPNLSRGVGHKVRKKRGEYLGIIFADFCLRERGDASNKFTAPYGQGRIYADTLKELESRTRHLRIKYEGITIVWAIHFAPYDCGSKLALLDWHLIAKSAETSHVAATLCGHTHVASVLKSNGHSTYCAGSAGAIDTEDTSMTHILEITTGVVPSITRSNFRWNRDAGEFYLYSRD